MASPCAWRSCTSWPAVKAPTNCRPMAHEIRTREGHTSMKLLLKNGLVVDPAARRHGQFDVLIDGDRIARVGKGIPADGARVVDVPAGFVIVPGLIDMLVHL